SGFYVCMRRPPRSTLFPTRRSSDLGMRGGRCRAVLRCSAVGAVVRARLPCDESGAVLAGSRPGWGVAEVRRCGPGSTPDAPPAVGRGATRRRTGVPRGYFRGEGRRPSLWSVKGRKRVDGLGGSARTVDLHLLPPVTGIDVSDGEREPSEFQRVLAQLHPDLPVVLGSGDVLLDRHRRHREGPADPLRVVGLLPGLRQRVPAGRRVVAFPEPSCRVLFQVVTERAAEAGHL